MKSCLILGVVLAFAASANATPASGHPQQVMDAKAVASKGPHGAQQPAPPRHLSEQERAELRRQLQQFNQQYTRRP